MFQGNFQFHCSFNRSKIWVALRADTVAWQIEMYLSRVTSLAAVVGTEYIDKMRAVDIKVAKMLIRLVICAIKQIKTKKRM